MRSCILLFALLLSGCSIGAKLPIDDNSQHGIATSQATVRFAFDANARLDGSHILTITIINNSATELRFAMDDLPWLQDSHIMLTILPEEGISAEPLKPEIAINDPIVGETAIAPGRSLVGRIDLWELFPKLKKISAERFIVFWFFRIGPEGTKPREFGGHLCIDANASVQREERHLPNKPPLRMPVSGTPAADAPVAPPPGIAGR